MEEVKEEKNYLILPEEYTNFDLSFKLVVIGDSGVGKSCLTKKATTNVFENFYSPTIGFEYYTFKIRIKDTDIRLQIWDTCGQETYRSLISSFYRNSSLAILVYSIDNKDSFKNLEIWLNELKVNSNPDVKIFLIGNKSDLENNREVTSTDAENFKMENSMNLFMESSAKTGFNAQEIFIEASKILYDEYQKYKNDKDKNLNNNDLNMNDKINMKNNDLDKKSSERPKRKQNHCC